MLNRKCAAATILLLVMGVAAHVQAQDTFGLGAAAPSNFAILEIGTGKTLSIMTTNVNGNIGVAGNSSSPDTLKLDSPSNINGQIIVQSSDTVNSQNSTPVEKNQNVTVGGQTYNSDTLLQDATTDADNVSSNYASKASGTATALNVSGNTTMNEGSGLTVLNYSSVSVTGTLTLSGNSNSVVVIDDSGDFTVHNGSILLDGIPDTNVLYNVYGTSGSVMVTGNGETVDGIVLAPNVDSQYDLSTINGEEIGGGNMTFVSPNRVTSPTPEPAFFQMGALLVMGGLAWRRRQKAACPETAIES